jgi:hypothetical protein
MNPDRSLEIKEAKTKINFKELIIKTQKLIANDSRHYYSLSCCFSKFKKN